MFKKPGTTAAPAKAAAKKAAAVTKKAAPATASRKAARDDDEDEDGYDGEEMSGGVTSGWGGAEKMAAEHSGFAARLQMKDGDTFVIKFLDDEPYANVATHWVKRKGRQSFICHGKARCPLCALGDNPRVSYCFNVVKLTDGDPLVLSWEVGIKLYRQIEKKAKAAQTSPLSKRWYALSRSGSGKDDTTYNLNALSTARLTDIIEEEGYGVVVPSEREIAKLVGYTVEDVNKQKASVKEMKELAAEISKDDDFDSDDDD